MANITDFDKEFGTKGRKGVYIKDVDMSPLWEDHMEMTVDGEIVYFTPVIFSDSIFAHLVEMFLKEQGYLVVRSSITPGRKADRYVYDRIANQVFGKKMDWQYGYKPVIVVTLVPEEDAHMAILDLSEAGAYA
jgi:hypothetical protein